MPARHQSPLHREVCRWFKPDSGAYLSHFGRVYLGGCRYVCVRAPLMSGFFSLNFFHHGRKDWRIYPPLGVGPSLMYSSVQVAQRLPVRSLRRLPRG